MRIYFALATGDMKTISTLITASGSNQAYKWFVGQCDEHLGIGKYHVQKFEFVEELCEPV